MDLKEIINGADSINDVIEALKQKTVSVPNWSDVEKEYNPKLHEIVTNKSTRKDKRRKDGSMDKVARLTYGLQKLSTRRMTQMSFAIPVKRIYEVGTDEVKKQQAKAIESIYKLCRVNSVNMKRMHAYFAACEIATVWYVVKKETKHKKYGFETQFELRCRTYSPMSEQFSRLENAELYPLFDEYGDMIAMSIEYVITESGKDVTYFEVYSKEMKKVWKDDTSGWVEVTKSLPITLGKIPAIYLNRPIPIWEDTTANVNEIELTLSRESDIIKKNSAPLIKITGALQIGTGVDPNADTAREVYKLEQGGDVSYVTWQQSVDAMKFMTATLKQNIEEELQLPNLSLENMKGLGAISGEARKTLLTDSHLKVGEESGDIIEFLEREFNVIKAFVGEMNSGWKNSINDLECEHIITPFIQNDEAATISKLTTATGGKQIMSQRTAIDQSGLVDDVDAELALIQGEEVISSQMNMFPTAE